MKITRKELKNLIKEEVSKIKRKTILENKKEEILNQLRMLNEGEEMHYVAVYPKLEGDSYVEILSDEDKVEELRRGGEWLVSGPFSKEEAEIEVEKIEKGNDLRRYLDSVDDEEANRKELDWQFSNNGKTPSHVRAIDDFHKDLEDLDQDKEELKSQKRNSKDW
jgi:hypothetical protein